MIHSRLVRCPCFSPRGSSASLINLPTMREFPYSLNPLVPSCHIPCCRNRPDFQPKITENQQPGKSRQKRQVHAYNIPFNHKERIHVLSHFCIYIHVHEGVCICIWIPVCSLCAVEFLTPTDPSYPQSASP